MIFGKKAPETADAVTNIASERCDVLILKSTSVSAEEPSILSCQKIAGAAAKIQISNPQIGLLATSDASRVITVFLCDTELEIVRQELAAATKQISLTLLVKPSGLTKLGEWLHTLATQELLKNTRLVVAEDPQQVEDALEKSFTAAGGINVIKMPTSPEVENTPYKYFYAFSPELQSVSQSIRELAENNVTRIYLLGAPGAGKTSLAYYYWLSRKRGRFIAVNLVSENTGDKTAVKSLICGHVAGAIPGTTSREGALAYAEDGVCFLDESHGMSGAVMEVLMEVLDNGQYLPLGATKKRMLDCAVVFASNRSWETLLHSLPLDEHARLGATVISIPNLSQRKEDIIAVVATTLARLKSQFTTWSSPHGVTPEAWKLLLSSPWRGNVRTLVRVIEAAAVRFARRQSREVCIDAADIQEGLSLWEPESHESMKLYASFEA